MIVVSEAQRNPIVQGVCYPIFDQFDNLPVFWIQLSDLQPIVMSGLVGKQLVKFLSHAL